MQNARHNGFTLIELSIVLVIIGLVAGSILAGRDLIRAANVRGAISELDKIKVAVTTFKTKYDCLPGDCGSITNFFGQDASCPNPTGNASATTTCNGNGDGTINGSEMVFFFQHLSLAKLIDEQIGLPTTAGLEGNIPIFMTYNNFGTILPQNSYQSHYYSNGNGSILAFGGGGGGFSVVGAGPLGIWWSGFLGASGAVPPSNFATSAYMLGGYGVNTLNFAPVMPASDAFAIDTKIDDGMPGTGNVQTYKDTLGYWASNGFPYCYTSTVATTAQYNLSAGGNICTLWFTTGF